MEKEMDMEIISNRMHIPNDMIVEILSWLSAESLLQLKRVCKYWFNLITRDPDFHKLHLHHSTSTNDHDSSVLCSASNSINGVPNHNLQCYLNYTTSSFSCSTKLNIACPFESCNKSLDLFTCINGLLFFFKQELHSFCIWNPCTKEYKELSVPVPPKFNYMRAQKRYLGKYGFGYDHTINDYKVVRNDYYYDDKHNYLASDVQIYTLGTNSWRSIGPVPYEQPRNLPLLEGGVFVNGALYWLLDHLGERIVSFDIGKEEYKEVLIKQLQPKSCHDIWQCIKKLQVFEGSLCCLVQVRIDDMFADEEYCFEMWMMEDYDVNNNEYSWTKLFRAPTLNYQHPILLRLTQNSEILMLVGRSDLVVYDPTTDTSTTLNSDTSTTLNRICKEEKCYQHVVDAVYTESLVSLNSGTYYPARLKNKKRKNEQR